MPSEFRSPKSLPRWIEPDYFRRRRLFRAWWRPLVLAALLLSLLAVGWTLAAGRFTAYQAGPLTASHAMFRNDCGKCHQGPFQTATRLWQGDGARSVPDSACQACHAGSHHHDQPAGACATCHREHHGEGRLVRVPDAKCTACHADLRRGDGKAVSCNPHVTRFGPGSHPEFRPLDEATPADPGRLRFNHAVHLDPAGVLTLDEKQREKVRRRAGELGAATDATQDPRTTVKLVCSDCHQPDAAGRYMKPISYEDHCRRCHPLAVQVIGTWKEPNLRQLSWEFARTAVPHPPPGGNAEAARALLRERLTAFILEPRNRPLLGAEESSERPVPGAARQPLDPQESWVQQHLRRTEQLLFDSPGGCAYCHLPKKETPRETGALPEYEKPNVPERWLLHARFNHHPHRMLACEECHGGASTSKTQADVLLPGVRACLNCHDSRKGDAARGDCVECHSYHDPAGQQEQRTRGRQRIEDILRK